MNVPPPGTVSDREILRRTSRSFALSIQVLPRGLRAPVEIAYLLARAADTVADTELAARETRIGLLSELQSSLGAGASDVTPRLEQLGERGLSGAGAEDPTIRAEAALLGQIAPLLQRFRELSPADREDVAAVVEGLVETMQGELAFFGGRGIVALPEASALVAYTEGIAGCVGAFWTRLAVRHCRGLRESIATSLEIEGRRYGRGLQLVNILRDLPRDLRRGICFLPASELAELGLEPADLLDASVATPLVPLLGRWERRAHRGLLAGLVYTARLPRNAWSLRFASALPAAIGLATLRHLRESPHRLDPSVKIRVGRAELKWILLQTAALAASGRGVLRLARLGKRAPRDEGPRKRV